MHILLIEDEKKLARAVQQGLEAEKHTVEVAFDGLTGEAMAHEDSFDLLIIDVGLPKKDGFALLKDLRAQDIRTPSLMLTARSSTEDIVKGLDLGADDYLTKPFEFRVLLARVRSLMRRGSTTTQLKIADLKLDAITHKASRGGKTIELTAREYALLEFLMRNAGRVISREDIAREIWGYHFDPGTNVIDVYVNHLRKKVDKEFGQKLIYTERGKGYSIVGKKLGKK
jgi:DNA-binding response OmpR family regulator